MTRNAVILIFVCTLSGVLFYIWKSGIDAETKQFGDAVAKHIAHKQDYSIAASDKYALVALRDIEPGSIIPVGSVEYKRVRSLSDFPSIAHHVEGRKATNRIRKGQIVRYEDAGWYVRIAIYAAKEIPAHKVIEAGDVSESKCFADGSAFSEPPRLSDVIGKRSKVRIARYSEILPPFFGRQVLEP